MSNLADLIVQEGRVAWPELSIPEEAVAQRVASLGADELPTHLADLYLAVGCTNSVPAALSIFERRFLAEVDDFVARVDSSRAFADEVKQRLRERLLVGPPMKMTEYSGRGPLGAWLRVTSVRIAIDLMRSAGAPGVREAPDDLASMSVDPELRLMRAEHRALVEASLRHALERLSARDRNVLRMYFGSGWTLDRIGKSYRVHRATVARWIAAIREALLADLEREVGEKLGLTADELRSLAALLRSQIEASLSDLGKQL